MKRLTLLLACFFISMGLATAQNTRVNGTVVDETGEPVIGASVVVKGNTSIGTVTDFDGNFTLDVSASAKTLIVKYLGMQDQEVAVAPNMKITLTINESVLDELLVVAYGTAKKSQFTGSASTLNAEKLEKRVSTNIVNSLAGQLPGVQIRSGDGSPNAQATMRIRGFTSLYAGNDPLIILDGAPYTGNLSSINQQDIETFTVLKDAAANSLYGSRAANGVVLITTKKGKSGGATISVDAKVGVKNHSTVEYDVIRDPGQYYEAYYGGLYNYYYNRLGQSEALASANANSMLLDRLQYNVFTVPDGESLIVNGKMNPNATLGRMVTMADGTQYYLQPDDWRDDAYRQALRQDYNVSISGGDEKSSFYASIGYLDEEGIVKESDFQRFTGRLKADYQAKKWLKVGANVSYYTYKMNEPGSYDSGAINSGNVFSFTSRLAPIYPLYIRDGNKNIMYDKYGVKRYDYGDGNNAGLFRPTLGNANPLSSILFDESSLNGSTFNATGFVDINFTEKLKLQINATSYVSEYRSTSYTNKIYGQYASSGGIVGVGHYRTNNYNYQQLLTYADQIDKHSYDVLLGHEYSDNKGYALSGSRNTVFSDLVHELNHAIKVSSASSSASRYNIESFFGRAQYNYDSKYFGSVSFRRDGSSRFHPNNCWGNFWSAGAGWLLDKETFMEDITWVDLLKLKASYGENGNDRISDYLYTRQYLIVESNGEVGTPFQSMGYPTISWEKNASFNVGFEFNLLDNRLNGSLEYFSRTSHDLLFQRPAPESAGYSSSYGNIGDLRNTGFELDLVGVIVDSPDFQWAINLNTTSVKNEMITLPPERVKTPEKGFASGDKWISVGGSIYDYYLFKFAGLNEYGESLYYKDVKDADGKVIGRDVTTKPSEATQYSGIGSAIPDFYGGFGTTLTYKGFDLSVAFDYQIGGKVYDGTYAALMSSPASGNKGAAIHKDVLKAWTPTNTGSGIPRYQDSESNDQNAASDRFLVNASYLNFQNINLGYTFPSKWTNKLEIKSLRLYGVVENVGYWSKRKGLDPRQSYSGSTRDTNYGVSRNITGGIQITF
ncbi:TonB-dependent receptor [Bacteroidales bacterium OttesenSCG-928-A17]|nr:TonB-dependent receptor [Bacteroidales bacterium OttesenSCG-928-A17]